MSKRMNSFGARAWASIKKDSLPSRWGNIFLLSVAYGATIFAVSVGAQWLLYHQFLANEGGIRWISPTIAACTTGLLIWRINRIRERERAAERSRIRALGDVNHHIRNCLQILVCENFARPQLSHESVAAIKRIDWTLKNVLPDLIETNEKKAPASSRLSRSEPLVIQERES